MKHLNITLKILLSLTLSLFAFEGTSAPKVDVSRLISPEECVRLLKDPRIFNRFNNEYWGRIDFQKGADDVKKARAWNKRLEERDWSFEELVKAGLVVIDSTTKNTLPNQVGALPYYIMRFPLIHTGLYFPSMRTSAKEALENPAKAFDPAIHKAINIVMPGIGTTMSKALGMHAFGNTYSNLKIDKENPKAYLGDTKDKMGYRAYSVLLDTSFNGLAEGIPGAFMEPEAIMVSIRHVQLILSHIYNFNRFIALGRSQGGLNALLYAKRYGPEDGLAGVVACNPSAPLREAMLWGQYVTMYTDQMDARYMGAPATAHARSWKGFNEYTDKYDLSGPSKAPSVIVRSEDDTTNYPQNLYGPWALDWQQADPDMRYIETFNGLDPTDAHNLWNYTTPVVYDPGNGQEWNLYHYVNRVMRRYFEEVF